MTVSGSFKQVLEQDSKIRGVKSWGEISERRLAGNYARLAEAAGSEVAVLAVIKANAYGHGVAVCAPVLARAGALWLGVTDAEEGETVLNSLTDSLPGMAAPPKILVMSGLLPEDAATIAGRGLTATVWTREQMEWLLAAPAVRSGKPVAVHLEVDSGMSRQGVAPGAALDALLGWIGEQPGIQLDGVLTHFASAEVVGSPQTHAQRKVFEEAVEAIARAGMGSGGRDFWVHAGNSSLIDTELGTVANTELGTEPGKGNLAWLRGLACRLNARPMVRTGIALYGYCLPIEAAGLRSYSGGVPSRGAVRPDLLPVLSWKTRILSLSEIPSGAAIGYNGTFTAPHAMRLALLPVGYADGLRRELSGSNAHAGGWAMVRGRCAPIAGRISMNLTTIDVTGIAEAAVGDEVLLLGDGVTAEDHARLAGTIPYEILCGLRASMLRG